MKKNIICDLDGTIACNLHRQHFLSKEKKDWDAFGKACCLDTPMEATIAILRAFEPTHKIHIFSGRMATPDVDEMTLSWLGRHQVPYHHIMLRADRDYRCDTEVKAEMAVLAGLTPENTILVLDDRNKVVEMWRNAGFTCHQVAIGDF